MINCPNCHADVAPGATTCGECGTHIESDPTVVFVPVADQHPALSPAEAEDVDGFEGYALIVERGPRAGMTFVLNPGSTTVGRHPDSDIFLDDVTVSRHHCRFNATTESLEVEDAGSTNGTYVNGSRVDEGPLAPGDEVLIGRFHLIVAHGDG
ncbi:MAG TPA: FHA domain-containing protein [Acidimicrobiia bacterium]|nr:FHA domain-containing protein [Acidimicrobiia bacterium]